MQCNGMGYAWVTEDVLPMVNIYLSLYVLLECVLMLMTSTTETYFFTAKLLKQGNRHHKIRKAFS